MAKLPGLIWDNIWTILVVLLPLVALTAIFFAPYGNATISNCSFRGFFETCGTVTGGSPLFGDVVEASSVITVSFFFLVALLGLTFFEIGIPWVIATAWSEGRGFTGWAIFEGILTSLGPWGGLQPTWGYWLITVCSWASLVAAVVRRDGVLTERDKFWESARQAAEEQARQERKAQTERQEAHDRAGWESARRGGQDDHERTDQWSSRTRRARHRDKSSPQTPPRAILEAAAVLGVSTEDSVGVIESAYREWAKLLHPDVNPNTRGATRQMQRINHARDTLLDYKRRPGTDS